MTEEKTQKRTAGDRFGRWIRVLSCTLVIAFLGAQGIAALPSGAANDHLSNESSSGLNPDNPFNYALFCFGNLEVGGGQGHHSTGAFAIGGDAKFADFSFAASNAAPGERGLSQLIVAGQLNFEALNTLRGNLEVSSVSNIHGSTYGFSSDAYHIVEGITVSFGDRKAAMVSRANSANSFAQTNSNAILSKQGGGGWLEVEAKTPAGFDASKDVLIFNLPEGTNKLYVPEGVNVIINVRGDSVNYFPQLVYGSFNSASTPNDGGDDRDRHVVWNFAEAKSIYVPDNLALPGNYQVFQKILLSFQQVTAEGLLCYKC